MEPQTEKEANALAGESLRHWLVVLGNQPVARDLSGASKEDGSFKTLQQLSKGYFVPVMCNLCSLLPVDGTPASATTNFERLPLFVCEWLVLSELCFAGLAVTTYVGPTASFGAAVLASATQQVCFARLFTARPSFGTRTIRLRCSILPLASLSPTRRLWRG